MEDFEFSWRVLGTCLDYEPELFFPAGETGLAAEQAQAAVAVCQECPVMLECLAYAVETGQRFGVWGGTTAEDRARIRRRWMAAMRKGNEISLEELVTTA